MLPKNQVSVHRELIEREKQKLHNNQTENFYLHNNNNTVSYHYRGIPSNNMDEGITQNLLSFKRIAAQKSSLSSPQINWEKNKKYNNQP